MLDCCTDIPTILKGLIVGLLQLQYRRSGPTDHCWLDSWTGLAGWRVLGLSVGRSSIGDHNLHTPNQRIDGRVERWIESTRWSVSEKE